MKKKKRTLYLLTLILFSALCGFLLGKFVFPQMHGIRPLWQLVMLLVAVYVSVFLHLALHEAGHLVFGLLTGYGFSSYRLGSLMLLNDNGKLRFKRFSLTGTAGQCLMTPPERADGKMPVVLYNLGGILLNLIFAAIAAAVCIFTGISGFAAVLLEVFALCGLLMALTNGLPLPALSVVANDGVNTRALCKDPDTVRAFYAQLRISERISRGERLRDMPEDWFTLPEGTSLANPLTAAIPVFACNRQLDAQHFEEAAASIDALLTADTGIIDLHRFLLQCDRLFIELVLKGENADMAAYLTPELKKFMKSMKNYPLIIRTEYAIALINKTDTSKITEFFEKVSEKYPYAGDIASERELMEHISRA